MVDKNRRRSERTSVNDTWTNVSVVTPFKKDSTEMIKVKIDNISISGTCIISEEPFELDEILQFHDEHIMKTGRVVWTCQSKIECTTGIQFDTVDD